MTIKDRFLHFLGMNDDEEYYEEVVEQQPEETTASPQSTKGKSNIVSIHTQKNIRLVLIEPRTFEEVNEISDHLKSHRPIVVNLHRLRRDHAQRIIDFLSGTVYALGGHVQKLGPHIFIFTPANVDVQGSITEILQDDSFQ